MSSSWKQAGSFRFLRSARGFDIDPERARVERVRAIVRSIQRDLDEGGRGRVRQIMNGPELYRIELERPDWRYNRTTIVDRETLTSLLEGTPETTVRASLRFR